MGKDRLYFLTFVSIVVVFFLSASIGINYSVKVCVNLLLELELESGKKEVQKIAYFLNHQIKEFNDSDIAYQVQDILSEVEPSTTYITVFDGENKVVCHPEISQINKDIIVSKYLANAINKSFKLSSVYDILMSYKKSPKNNTSHSLEVLYEKNIKRSNLKLASVLNTDKLLLYVVKLERRLYTIFILMGVLIISISFFTVRLIGSYYEKKLESKNLDLENDIITLTKLNLGISIYQQRIKNSEEEIKTESTTETQDQKKNRFLTYKGNELIPTLANNIAYIYSENSITYVINNKGEKSVSNSSLDEIYGNLNTTLFFRANRQFIVHIANIEKIIKYGNSQLKIVLDNSDAKILISKNKASEFKKWLNV
ncbi:LytR/AlgR family response regulator transcription factor [Tenacibaculum agarivorans]|uniref:LytR/AlgR family response regulator transcription factor n=1 Tax=Tenacibaculum agarivorans TaxID=1908389 RepID=UPI00094B7B5B|nr:LytTR family DNA-binding domain-containing protein [Tenacibaculum agarivorans]